MTKTQNHKSHKPRVDDQAKAQQTRRPTSQHYNHSPLTKHQNTQRFVIVSRESTMDEGRQQQKRVPENQRVAATAATIEHPEAGSNSISINTASTSTSPGTATESKTTTIAASASPVASPAAAAAACAWEERVQLVREHYERKGYRVRSGLQFGCELVLYADDLGSVHSDFCIHVVPQGNEKIISYHAMPCMHPTMHITHYAHDIVLLLCPCTC
jgi:hypothetical protein